MKRWGSRSSTRVEVSFGKNTSYRRVRRLHLFRGCAQRCVLLRLRRHQEPVRHLGTRNFTAPHLADSTGNRRGRAQDSNSDANVFSTVLELPTSYLGADPDVRIWGRCSLRRDGKLEHVDSAGHPSVSSFFNTDDTKLEYNASEPVNDRGRWIDKFIHLMGHTGGYTREEAIAAIDTRGHAAGHVDVQPVQTGEVSERPGVHRRRDRIPARVLTKGECPPSGLSPHTDTLTRVPSPGHAALIMVALRSATISSQSSTMNASLAPTMVAPPRPG